MRSCILQHAESFRRPRSSTCTKRGRIAYETDGANTTLATFTYSPTGTPTSVTVGSNPSTDPRYYYVYNPHGDVVALVDGGGTTVATYSYDEYGNPTIWERFTNGWHNPYLYDGLERVRYDSETGLYWMSVRAYDPTLGRFISHDPLGRAPLFFDASQPYAYGGNNPLRNTDPSGQFPSGVIIDNGVFYFQGHGATQIHHRDCAAPVDQMEYQDCLSIWKSGANEDRTTYLESAVRQYSGLLVAGYSLLAAADFIAARQKASIALKVEGYLDLVLSLASAALYLPGLITGRQNSSLQPGFDWILGVLHTIGLGVRWVLAALHKFGAFAEVAAEATVAATEVSSGGVIGFLLKLVSFIAGPVINNILSGVAHGLIALGQAALTFVDGQFSMDIVVWCTDWVPAGVCSSPPPLP